MFKPIQQSIDETKSEIPQRMVEFGEKTWEIIAIRTNAGKADEMLFWGTIALAVSVGISETASEVLRDMKLFV